MQLAVGLLIGLVGGSVLTLALTQPYIRKLESENRKNWQPVVTAFVEIKPNTHITRSMLMLNLFPPELIASDSLTAVERTEGRTTTRLIRAREQIHTADLAGQ
jgi:hypothetical protein